MSNSSVDGLISGLDTTSLINQLMQIERIPQQRLQLTLNKQNTSVAAFQSIATRLKSVETAVATLAKEATWGARTVAVTGTSVTAIAAPGATAGRSTVNVLNLATAATFTAQQTLGLDDPVVSSNPPQVTIRNAAGIDVVISPASGSMRDLMAAINATPESGMTAIAVKVGPDAYRLQLRATETGTAAAPQSVTGLSVTLDAVAAQNAQYDVDGIVGTASSNTVQDLLPGVTVSFSALGSSTVTVGTTSTAATDAVKAVVDEVNKALDEIAKQTAAGGNGTTRGALGSDSQVRALSDSLLRSVSDAVGGRVAAELGLQTTKGGRLTFDPAVFEAAYAKDPAGTRSLVAPTDGGIGIGQRLSEVVKRATNPADGLLTTSVQGRERTVKELQTQIDKWDVRLESRRAMLTRQFSALEVSLQRLQGQGSFLSGALAGLSRQS